MKKMELYATPALMAGLLILNIGGIMAAVACTSGMPERLFPAYYFNIQFPDREESISTLTIERGSSVTLPVTVTSNSDVPICIRLTQDDQRILPEFITFETQKEYITLQSGDNTTLHVTFHVSDFAITGRYTTGIHGELREPVEDRALITQGFSLVVTDRTREGGIDVNN